MIAEFTITNQDLWNDYVEKNTSAYGREIIEYAARWANLIEAEIEKGQALEDIAKETSHQADTNGITGFMFGAAVHTLARTWKHGESLRQWHNLDCGPEQGKKANQQGGTINPAVFTMK